MYHAAQWASWGVPQSILDLARASHDRLAKVVDGERMSYIAGCNQVTKVDVNDWNRLDHADAYTDSMAGDGTVPHALGFLYDETRNASRLILSNARTAPCRIAPKSSPPPIKFSRPANAICPPAIPAQRAPRLRSNEMRAAKRTREIGEEETMRELSRRVRARSRAVGDVHETPVSPDEITAANILVRSFLEDESATAAAPAAASACSSDCRNFAPRKDKRRFPSLFLSCTAASKERRPAGQSRRNFRRTLRWRRAAICRAGDRSRRQRKDRGEKSEEPTRTTNCSSRRSAVAA